MAENKTNQKSLNGLAQHLSNKPKSNSSSNNSSNKKN